MRRAIWAVAFVLFFTAYSSPKDAGLPLDWPLNQAVIANDLKELKNLLSIDTRSQEELDYALIAAAGKGRPEVARMLIAAGANPNFKLPMITGGNHSAIIVATRENNPGVLEVLLENGGNPNIQDALKWRPLHHAVLPTAEHLEVIKILVKHGADVNARDRLQRTALHRAAGFGHIRAVQLLLQLGADATLREKYGRTAAERAEQAGHRALAQLLKKTQ